MSAESKLTSAEINHVWDILVEECGALESERDEFRAHWPECREYRFIGALGFGGKVWYSGGQVRVSCYREDETPERLALIVSANTDLEPINDLLRARSYPGVNE